MTAPATLRYPGDDPATLAAAADQIDQAGVRVERIIDAVGLSRSALREAWTTQATSLADADIGLLVEGLPTVRSSLSTAHTAVLAHRSTLSRIRLDIDDLQSRLRQQQRAFDAADANYRELASRTDPMAGIIRDQFAAQGRSATAAQEAIVAQYQQLVREANTSAQTCADAMTTAWDPTGRSAGVCLADPGAVLLDQAGLSASSLNMLRIDAAAAEAVKLAADLADEDYLIATDPQVQAKFARLAEIWEREGDNGIFATAFYSDLGAADTVDLMARVAVVIQPSPFDSDTGAITPALLRGLQENLGGGMATATQGIEYGTDGALHDTVPGGLGADWVNSLMQAGRSDLSVPWNQIPLQVKGYVPLMATLAAGSGYSAGFLRALGDDMRAVELQRSEEFGATYGETAWIPEVGVRVRWDWSATEYDFPMGNDPFTSWTTAMVNSPGAATTVLATDPDLLNHLLNERSWMLRDSGNNSGPEQVWYRIADDNEPLAGLSAFGSALPLMVGQGALSEDSRTAFDSVVRFLGDRDFNSRIDGGNFQETDWIPPELRPGVGALLTLNADTLNEVFAVPNDTGTEAYSRVLADVGKDQGTDAGGHTIIDRLMAAEASVINAEILDNRFSSADLDAQARIAATLAHGNGAADLGLQQAADAAHNANVSTIATATNLLVDTSSTPLRWTKEAYKLFGGDLVQSFYSQFMQDTALPARNDHADWTSDFGDQIKLTAANQWYASRFDDLPPAGPNVHLYGSDGAPLLWSELDGTTVDWVDQHFPGGVEQSPTKMASDAWTAFDGQVTAMKTYRVPYPDGT